jgi:peptidoglycan/LPS O-acetylase OafA/YrhL
MKQQFDVPRLAIGAGVTAALSVGLAATLLHHAYHTANEGPTSATLEEAYDAFYGAGLGLVLGSAITAILARRGSRLLNGIAAGVVAYALVLAPILVFSGPSDVGLGEEVGFAAVLALPALVFAALGAMLGSWTGTVLRRKK